VSEHFDPYADWLGIRDPARPVSHYQLLGVADFEDNALAIAVGADAAATCLKACSPGLLTGRWQQLADEVALARLCLLDAARKRQYDEQLRKRLATSNQKRDPEENSASPILANAEGVKAESKVPHPSTQTDFFPPAFRRQHNTEAMPEVDTSRIEDSSAVSPSAFQNPDETPSPLPTEAIPASIIRAEVPKALPLVQPVTLFAARPDQVFIPADDISDTFSPPKETKRPWSPSLPMTIVAGVIASGGMLGAVYWHSAFGPPTTTVPPAPEVVQNLSEPSGIPGERASETKKSPPTGDTTPPDTVSTLQPQGPTVSPGVTAVIPPRPMESATPTPDLTPSAEERAAFENGIREAVARLRSRNLDQFRELLQRVRKTAKSEEQQQRLQQLEHLHGYVDGFWKAVRNSFLALQATDTLRVGNTEVAIVEIDGDRITIRDAGRNQKYAFSELPLEIVVALANQWFDTSKPSNKLYLGAFYAVDAQGDLQKARELWQEATSAGASADTVMPLLEDPAITSIPH
jgi:hypothetical protein